MKKLALETINPTISASDHVLVTINGKVYRVPANLMLAPNGYKGTAILTTNPTTPAAGDWYWAIQTGVFTNFSGKTAENGNQLVYNGSSWDVIPLPLELYATLEDLAEVQEYIENVEGLLTNRVDTLTYSDITQLWTSTNNFITADILNNLKVGVFDENNNIKYWLGADARFKENGQPANIYGYKVNTTKNINGTDYTILAADFGQVKVAFPKMFYSHAKVGDIHTKSISRYYFLGSKVHPSFKRYNAAAGKVIEVDYAYIGRYEGVLFDASKNRCVNGIYIDGTISAVASTKTINFETPTQFLAIGDVLKETTNKLGPANSVYTIATVTLDANKLCTSCTVNETILDATAGSIIALRNDIDLTADYLMSVSGYKPITYISQTEARTLSKNYSALQSQQVYADWFLIQLLAIYKYGTGNIQTALGAGKTASTGEYKYVSVTGLFDAAALTDSVNNTNNLQFSGGSLLFGLENTWGNLWKWLDGLNINDWLITLSEDNSQFEVSASYYNTGIELPHSNGYWGKLMNQDLILPATVDGSSSNEIGDYFYQSSGSRVALVGGDLSSSARGGLSIFYGNLAASSRGWSIAGRVRS